MGRRSTITAATTAAGQASECTRDAVNAIQLIGAAALVGTGTP